MSEESHKIKLYLTTRQKGKLERQEPFQLSKAQIETTSAKHEVDVELTKSAYKKLMLNMKKGKGFRFKKEDIVSMEGGSIKGFFKSVGRTLKSVGNEAVNSVGKEVSKVGKKALKDAGQQVLQSGLDALETGAGLKRQRFAKGSQEAKDFMAKLRSMKKKGKGIEPVAVEGGRIEPMPVAVDEPEKKKKKTSILKSAGRYIKKAGMDIIKEATPHLKRVAKAGLKAGIKEGLYSLSGDHPLVPPMSENIVNKHVDDLMGTGLKRRGRKGKKKHSSASSVIAPDYVLLPHRTPVQGGIDAFGVPEPIIVSKSGRGFVAYGQN